MKSNIQNILAFSWPMAFGVLGAVVALITIYEKIFKPYTLKAKLKAINDMITDWFDEIDCNLEAGLNIAKLNNKENKIHAYIRDNLSRVQIKPDRILIRKWNIMMGVKEEYQDSFELFEKYSRLPADGAFLEVYINLLIGNFYSFYQLYQSKSEKCNYAEVQMPVKFLNFYVKNV